MKIFHLIDKDTWEKVKTAGADYAPETLKRDGFIHCCKADQIDLIIRSFFKQVAQVVLIEIDQKKLSAKVAMEGAIELPQSEVLFPHIMGPLNLDAVVKEFYLKKDKNGNHLIPDTLF